MSFLPIVERELRTAGRRASTYRSRTAVVLVTSLTAALLLLVADQAATRAMGNAVFTTLATLAFLYCGLTGAQQAADCLSEEKREGTLGLLFLTDLRGYDVVLGKLVAVSAKAFQGLFAFFPVLSVGLLLGGLTAGEFWRAAAVLTNTLFFAVCIGLLVSALTKQSHVALALTLSVVVLLTLAPLCAEWLLSKIGQNHDGLFRWMSPAGAGRLAADTVYNLGVGRFWVALGLNHLLGWLCLVLASIALPNSWQDRPSRSRALLLARPVASASLASKSAKQSTLRAQLLDANPISWLAGRNEWEVRWTRLFTVVVILSAALILCLSWLLHGYSFGSFWFLCFISGWVLKLWVAWHACATLAEARRTGAVELLLSTPLQVEQIIDGQWQALRRLFTLPLGAVLLLLVLPVFEGLARQPAGNNRLWFFPIPIVTLFSMATLVLDLGALASVGMWMGLSQPKPMQAFAKTLLFVVIVPTIAFCVPNLLFDVFWISWARGKLSRQFRSTAMEIYAPAPGQLVLGPRTGSPLPPVIRPSIRLREFDADEEATGR